MDRMIEAFLVGAEPEDHLSNVKINTLSLVA